MTTIRTGNVVQQRESRYVQGGSTDRHPNRIGWWERRLIPKSDSDIVVFVQPQEVHRPDLIANRVYGKANLQWLVLQYNSIVDIQTEIVLGKALRLPNQRRVTMDIMSRPTGGNRLK